MQTKDFHLSDILSITTSRLVSSRHIEGVYDILNFMTGESLFTHALPRAADECRPHLIKQYPWLADLDENEITTENWQEWTDNVIKKYGEFFPVNTIPVGEHLSIDPIVELNVLMSRKDDVS